eukprot:CAMPEP_0180054146 /NCGR_PEP_ID=MMETSP0985-20121206/2678_1 /TAXON_ID=483367 /ORGANISM="non described non described, Strain CCMP 2436" /LENGTH=137 /DNA_ID=CAMNT_0021983733 /DNA_START=68 /DNA_END=478 /DNA_ORIENTATION=+
MTLGVRVDLRRRGLGRRLLQECMDSALRAGCVCAYLHTLSTNERAIRMYEKALFLRLHTVRRYYLSSSFLLPGPDDADAELYACYLRNGAPPVTLGLLGRGGSRSHSSSARSAAAQPPATGTSADGAAEVLVVAYHP